MVGLILLRRLILELIIHRQVQPVITYSIAIRFEVELNMSDIVFLVAYPPSGSGNSMKAPEKDYEFCAALTIRAHAFSGSLCY